MPKKRNSPSKFKKNARALRKQKIADDIYVAQAEDLEYLLNKKKRLNRKELFKNDLPTTCPEDG